MDLTKFFIEDGVLNLSPLTYIILSSILFLSLTELLKKTIFKENETSPRKIFFILSGLSIFYLGWTCFPAYFKSSLYTNMSQVFAEQEIENRIEIARTNILNPDSKLLADDMLGLSMVAKEAMRKMPFRTSLASIHPDTSTAPVFAGTLFQLFTKVEKDGDDFYLKNRFTASAELFPNVRIEVGDEYERTMLLGRVELIEHFNEKYPDGIVKIGNSFVCVNEVNFLKITEVDCSLSTAE